MTANGNKNHKLFLSVRKWVGSRDGLWLSFQSKSNKQIPIPKPQNINLTVEQCIRSESKPKPINTYNIFQFQFQFPMHNNTIILILTYYRLGAYLHSRIQIHIHIGLLGLVLGHISLRAPPALPYPIYFIGAARLLTHCTLLVVAIDERIGQ